MVYGLQNRKMVQKQLFVITATISNLEQNTMLYLSSSFLKKKKKYCVYKVQYIIG